MNFNPLAPRGARHVPMRGIPTCYVISIHSPLAGRDNNRSLLSYDIGISIHSPLAGRDPDRDQHTVQQSLYFNPLAPRGARPAEAPTVDRNGQISIHSPLAGRDPAGAYIIDPLGISIHSPLAGRDRNLDPVLRKLLISIHSPHAGRDKLGVSHVTVLNWISIHSPLAGRD